MKFFQSLHEVEPGQLMAAGEFDLVDVPFDTRGIRTDEMLAIIRLLHSGENVEFNGQFFTLPPCVQKKKDSMSRFAEQS